jgi:uncharacterized membrane protein YqhA
MRHAWINRGWSWCSRRTNLIWALLGARLSTTFILFGEFSGLRVYLVDEYDIFVSKLSSRREKNQDDLRVLSEKLDKELARKLLLTDGVHFLENSGKKSCIEENWQFLYRESLFD